MILYHGTSITHYKKMVPSSGNLNVKTNLGGGELGLGFYLGECKTTAIQWAVGIHNKNACVLEFDIPNSDFAKLNLRPLTHTQVIYWWKHLSLNKQQRSHTYEVDVLISPIAVYPELNQYKFESLDAELLLNKCKIKKIY